MNFHSILHRELLISSKRRTTYHARSLIGGVAGVVALALVKSTVRGLVAPADTGRYLLLSLASLGMTLVLIEGILITVDSISCERREGTLGLLFLSNLTGYDIVIGKAGGAGLRTLFALIAASAAPALTFLFGGVTLIEYFKVILALLNGLFFALSLGLFISAFSITRRKGAAIATLLLIWFLIGAPLVGSILGNHNKMLGGLFIMGSPALPLLFLIFPPPSASALFFVGLASSNIIAWALLIGAGCALNRNWRMTPALEREPSVGLPAPMRSISNRDPMFGLAWRRGISLKPFWTSCAVAGFATLAVLIFASGSARFLCYAVILWCLHGVLSITISTAASKAMAEDRTSGLLELLLTTPLDETAIARGHLLALKRKAAGAFAFLVFLGSYLLFVFSLDAPAGHVFLMALVYGMLLLLHLFEMTFSARIALWKGLIWRNGVQGFRRLTGTAAMMGVAVFAFGAFVTLTLSPALSSPVLTIAVATAFLLGLGAGAAGLLAVATRRLSEEIRASAATSFQAGKS